MTWEAPVQMVQTWSIEVTSNPQKDRKCCNWSL
jgi:hypothetical protein